jgi:hypothetical protein
LIDILRTGANMARHCIQWRYAIGGAIVAALALAMPQAVAQEATPDSAAQLRGACPPDTGRVAPSPVVPGRHYPQTPPSYRARRRPTGRCRQVGK